MKACGLICGSELIGAIHDVHDQIENNRGFKIVLDAFVVGKRAINGLSTNIDGVMDRTIDMESDRDPPRHTSRKVNDALMYIYTSGTTGLPKVCILLDNNNGYLGNYHNSCEI